MVKPEYVVVHHSLTKDGQVVDWEAIRRYHVETNGWADIGYQYGIEMVNGVYVQKVGRALTMDGAHCKEAGMNRRSLGLCVVGNFDLAPPSIEQLRFVRDAVWAMVVNFGIPIGNVIGHRDAGLMDGFDWTKGQFKTCPGRMFPMETLRDAVAGKITF